MYLVGGSHSEHFLPALDTVARQRGIRIVPLLKIGCALGMGGTMTWDGDDYPQCEEWDRKAQQWILRNPPSDGVFTTTTRPPGIGNAGPDAVPAGYLDVLSRFSASGIHVWGVRDTPWMQDSKGDPLDPTLCVAGGSYRSDDPSRDCGVAREQALAPVNPAVAAFAGTAPDITHIDLSDAFCTGDRCLSVIGNVLAYRDDHHLSTVYARMLAPELDRQMFGRADRAD